MSSSSIPFSSSASSIDSRSSSAHLALAPAATKISPLKGAFNRVKSIPSSLKPSNLAVRTKSKSPNQLQPAAKPKTTPNSLGVNNGVGMCLIEVNRASGLPYWKAVTRLSFDMDPFVIISFGKKIFRTRVIRHSMVPVWDESLFFHVQKSEMSFSILFSMYDWDKMSSNDYIGDSELLLQDLVNDTARNMRLDPETGLYQLDENGKLIGDRMTAYELPVVHSLSSSSKSPPSTDHTGEPSQVTYNGKLSIKAKFIPYSAMRQVFWRKYLEEFDTDESGTISTTELTSMLDSLGSTLTRETIAGFFSRYGKSSYKDQDTLSFEQVIGCLESELLKPPHERNHIVSEDEQIGVGIPAVGSDRAQEIMDDENQDEENLSVADPSSSPSSPLVSISFIGHNPMDVTKNPSQMESLANSPRSNNLDEISTDEPSSPTQPRSRSRLQCEKVVHISCCPICHQQQAQSQVEIDMVTHMAVCASKDWASLQNILSPGNFVTSSQANRKWFTKVIGKVQNGKYSLGANSANIIVQDRRTGRLIEEKMQAYVRLGIRMMYKSGSGSTKENRMEHQKIKKLLKSLTIKQGNKFNSPDSIKEITPFINFHELDVNEIKLPLSEFKNFNEFFYRELKPDARPIESPEDPLILTSVADCRLMVFKDIHQSKLLWIKGRRFSLRKLLGDLGRRNIPSTATTDSLSPLVEEKQTIPNPEENENEGSNDNSINSNTSTIFSNDPNGDGDEYKWALGIFRLAPQDYHRFHAPIDGKIVDVEYMEGQYYTVNPMGIRSQIDVFGENVRVVVCIQTEKFNKVFCVFVGAMMVGSINMSIKLGDQVKKGDDIGYFAFGQSLSLKHGDFSQTVMQKTVIHQTDVLFGNVVGGSTILMIVETDKIEWDDDLQTNSSKS
ncbi:phosphatidylserine decarboxylase [Puccinia sorghi]|uniref:phosphatidylserine decarboxylase n=1 Tax=Puccinia sorghi TaxID=27349 RepID=A0A0L6VAU3_9BASI|nr:phosphatidylserine decarboxylase [Puccinia sorghi]